MSGNVKHAFRVVVFQPKVGFQPVDGGKLQNFRQITAVRFLRPQTVMLLRLRQVGDGQRIRKFFLHKYIPRVIYV